MMCQMTHFYLLLLPERKIINLNVQMTKAWVKIRNTQNPELKKLVTLNVQYACKPITIPSLNDKLSLDKLKTYQRTYNNLPNSAF